MLTLKRNTNVLRIEVDSGIGWTFHFKHTLSDEPYAILLREKLQAKMSDYMEKARREAYEHGWKDAKAKKTKQTWLSGKTD